MKNIYVNKISKNRKSVKSTTSLHLVKYTLIRSHYTNNNINANSKTLRSEINAYLRNTFSILIFQNNSFY